MKHIKSTKGGLVETKTGRKIVSPSDKQYKESIHHCALRFLHDRLTCFHEKPEDIKVMLKHAIKIMDDYIKLWTASDRVSY